MCLPEQVIGFAGFTAPLSIATHAVFTAPDQQATVVGQGFDRCVGDTGARAQQQNAEGRGRVDLEAAGRNLPVTAEAETIFAGRDAFQEAVILDPYSPAAYCGLGIPYEPGQKSLDIASMAAEIAENIGS